MAGVAAAAVVSLVWAIIAIGLGPRFGFVDRPDDTDLKVHDKPAVTLGGVGVFLGVHIGMTIGNRFDAWLAIATGGLVILGIVDDRVGLSPRLRLVVQVALAYLIAAFATTGWSSDPIPIVVGIVLVVGTINAVNLFDGLDGLAASSALVAALGIAALAEVRGLNSTFGLILAAALAGFLLLNWHPAKIFLGDNGSYVVGAFLAYGIMRTSPGSIDSRLFVALVLLGVFALDLATTIVRRRMAGRPLFLGDRSHLYDQLRTRGRSVRAVALITAAVEVVYVTISLGIEQVGNGPARLLLVGLVAGLSLVAVGAGGFLRPQED